PAPGRAVVRHAWPETECRRHGDRVDVERDRGAIDGCCARGGGSLRPFWFGGCGGLGCYRGGARGDVDSVAPRGGDRSAPRVAGGVTWPWPSRRSREGWGRRHRNFAGRNADACVTMVAMFASILTLLVLAAPLPQAGTLTFTKPAGWTDRAAASSMRVAEFVVPRAPGDAEDGELIVYYFGGNGGSVEANRQRWTAQFQSTKDPSRTTGTVNGLRLTTLDVSGTYVAEVRPGS